MTYLKPFYRLLFVVMLLGLLVAVPYRVGCAQVSCPPMSDGVHGVQCQVPVTFTSDGWVYFSNPYNGIIPNGVLYNRFPIVFRDFYFFGKLYHNQILVGAPLNVYNRGYHSIQFDGVAFGLSQLVNILAGSGPCDRLFLAYKNPSYLLNKYGQKTYNDLASETLALTLNIAYNDMRQMPRTPGYDLECFVVKYGILRGRTVGDVLKIANKVLAGVAPCTLGLNPPDDPSNMEQGCENLEEILEAINANYEFINYGLTVDRGYLKPNVAFGLPGTPHPAVVAY
ncbi:MAG: hypothetical protein ABFD54_14075 [Armatimonadota bacterium]|nr:hypothetical protein [bacterium]